MVMDMSQLRNDRDERLEPVNNNQGDSDSQYVCGKEKNPVRIILNIQVR